MTAAVTEVPVGRCDVRIVTESDERLAPFRRLFDSYRLGAPLPGPRRAQTWVVVTQAGGDALVVSDEHGAAVVTASSPSETASQLVHLLNHEAIVGVEDRLALHGGGVARHGRGLAIVGRSGAGKSTLVAQLLGSGLTYLSDEVLYLARGEPATGLAKPLSIKGTGRALLAPRSDGPPSEDAAETQVPPGDLDATIARQAWVDVVARVAYRAGAPTCVRDLTSAEVAAALIDNSFNLDRLAAPWAVIGDVATRAHGVHLEYGDGAEAVRILLERLSRAPREPAPLQMRVTPDGPRCPTGDPEGIDERFIVRAAPGVTTLRFADSCLVLAANDREYVVLDESSARIWSSFDGTRTIEAISRGEPVPLGAARAAIVSFARDIGRRGFIAGVRRSGPVARWEDQ